MKLASNFRHRVRARVWLPVHGRHFVYRGTTIHVLEDEERHRWICLADMQAVVGVTASERALSVTYPDRLQLMGRPAQTYMRDDAMVAHLGKEKQLMVLKFRTWLDRSVRVPGANVRKGLRIREVVNAGLRRRP